MKDVLDVGNRQVTGGLHAYRQLVEREVGVFYTRAAGLEAADAYWLGVSTVLECERPHGVRRLLLGLDESDPHASRGTHAAHDDVAATDGR